MCVCVCCVAVQTVLMSEYLYSTSQCCWSIRSFISFGSKASMENVHPVCEQTKEKRRKGPEEDKSLIQMEIRQAQRVPSFFYHVVKQLVIDVESLGLMKTVPH